MLLMLAVPGWMQADPPASPIGGHLVGTVLGEPEGLGISDFRTEADVLELSDFAFLPGGDMVVADAVQGRVLRVGADGITRLFAGNGSTVSSGDNGPAAEAGVPHAAKLAVDAAGNVYVAQVSQRHTFIRKITPDGIIQTVAGNGETGCPVLGASAESTPIGHIRALSSDATGRLYFYAANCDRVFRVNGDGTVGLAGVTAGADPPPVNPVASKGIPAASATFPSVSDLAVDAFGNVLAVEQQGRVIRRITPDGVVLDVSGLLGSLVRQGSLSTVGLPRVVSIATVPGGALAIAQEHTETVGRAELGITNAAGNYAIVFSQDGHGGKPMPMFQGLRVNPNLVRVAPDGKIYVRDSFSHSVFEAREDGALVHQFRAYRRTSPSISVGANPTFRSLRITNLIADGQGALYFGDPVLQKIYRLTPDLVLSEIAGTGNSSFSGDGQSPLDAGLALGSRIGIDGDGRIYFATADSQRIRRFSVTGTIETLVGGGTEGPPADGRAGKDAMLNGPIRWAVSAAGEVYLYHRLLQPGSGERHVIWKLGNDGKLNRFLGAVSGSPSVGLEGQPALDAYLPGVPEELEVDPAGTVFFHGSGFGQVFLVDAGGVVQPVAGSGVATEVVDGGATLTAPAPIWGVFVPRAAGKLLVNAGHPQVMAEYEAGGTVTVLRRSDAGQPRQDGGVLANDRLVFTRSVVQLPDGGLAWSEGGNNQVTIRRSFPVPAGCTYSASATELPVGGGNNLTQVTLSTGTDCPWTVGSSASWLEILSPRSGTGNVTVQLRALANPGPSQRTARLLVAGSEVVVIQAPSTRTDIFVVSPSAATVPPEGGAVAVSIVASPQQSWQVSLPQAPVTLTGPAAGSGSADLSVAIPALPQGVSQRTLVLQVNDRSVVFTQAVAPAPVTVSISANLPGTTAVIDLVERPLPFQGVWLPGSTHLVSFTPVREVNAETRVQFLGWADGDEQPERVFLTPANNTTASASFRRLHRLRLRSFAGPNPISSAAAVNYAGVQMPPELTEAPTQEGGSIRWFAEGETVSVFAPTPHSLQFVSFTGSVTTTQNPITVGMESPRDISANYGEDGTIGPRLRVGGQARWAFLDGGRSASPAQVTVAPHDGAVAEDPIRFVAYNQFEAPGEWLQVRQDADGVPFTAEFSLVPEKAEQLTNGSAIVYVHIPGSVSAMVPAGFEQKEAIDGTAPWIAAVTDAGGFRQTVSDGEGANLVAAPGMILTLFGGNFSEETALASSVPLPNMLAGTIVEYLPTTGVDWVRLPLYYVSPTQINFQVPPDEFASAGHGTQIRLRVRRDSVLSSAQPVIQLRARSVSLFSADSSGRGAPAGFFVRVRSNGEQERGDLFTCGNGQCAVAAAPLGGTDDELFLELFGTGFRNPGEAGEMAVFVGGKPAEISFAGPHPVFVGLDQINVKMPRDTARGQVLDLYVWVRNADLSWIASNRLSVRFE